MKILLVYDALSKTGGGDQVATFLWLQNLKKLGIEAKLLCDQNIPDNVPLEKTDFIINPSINLGLFPLSLFLFPRTKKDILAFKPDVIHIQEQLPMGYQVLQLAKKHHIPVLCSYHTNAYKFKVNKFPLSLFVHEGGIYNKAINAFSFSMYKQSEAVTVPTNFIQKEIRNRLPHVPFVVPSPVSSQFFLPNKPFSPPIKKLITVSRLSGEKHVDMLVDMMALLKNSFTLTIVGHGVDEAFLKRKVHDLGLSGVITFTGWVKQQDMPALIQEHDLFLSASSFETFGLTYIEALATHTPCVVFDTAVGREVIPNTMAIFVKDLRPQTWADTLLNLQGHPKHFSLLKEAIAKDYHLIKAYDEVQSTKTLIKVYNGMLETKHPQH